MKSLLSNLRHSFAFQLLVVHVKKNLGLLAFWGLLFGIATSTIGVSYGAPYTMLDPEYMDNVSFWSFWWVGITFGFFTTAWQLSCYMLNSFRFPFLATSRRPFLHFCINNSVIPLLFVITYIICVINFQLHNEFTPSFRVPLYISGFLGGLIFICLLFGIYFHYTNHDIKTIKTGQLLKGGLFRPAKPSHEQTAETIRKIPDWEQPYRNPKIERVDNYINAQFRVRPTRGTEHYTETSLNAVFQQHHTNALVVQFAALFFTLFLGFSADIPIFQLPAVSSILLIMSIIVSFMGAFTYWLTGWRSISAIVVFLILNQSSRFNFLNYNTPAFGLNYSVPAALYSDTLIKESVTDAQIAADRAYMLPILENWKCKAQATQGLSADEKPDMILLNFNGGGSRSMLWSMVVAQHLDSLLNGKLLDNTFLMAGASGGVLGATYVREFLYQYYQPSPANKHIAQMPRQARFLAMDSLSRQYALDNAGKDFLNPIFYTAATNDLFYPLRRFKVGNNDYRRNRAYSFEKQYHINTDSIIANRTIADYKIAEQNAEMPLLIVTPTIVSNGKKLVITPHPVSYLCRPTNAYYFKHDAIETDGIQLSYMQQQSGYDLLLSSAIRMNATYPFILPDTYLPTEPPMQIMDAGFRDNHGYETTLRMLLVFNEWLKENTDEIVMVFVRSDEKDEAQNYPKQSYLERYFKPIQAFISTDMQDYQIDFATAAADQALNGQLTVLHFQYQPTPNNARASMSLHLTKKEKNDLRNAIYMPCNSQSTNALLHILAEPPPKK